MNQPDPIQRMIQRVAQCRQLASALHNEKAAQVMLQMADEGEAEIRRLLTDKGGSFNVR